jgi:hypothetical protein
VEITDSNLDMLTVDVDKLSKRNQCLSNKWDSGFWGALLFPVHSLGFALVGGCQAKWSTLSELFETGKMRMCHTLKHKK